MAPIAALGKSFLFLLLCGTGAAKAVFRSPIHDLSHLAGRQDTELPAAACWKSCEIGRCGGGTCSIGALSARSEGSSLLERTVANISDYDAPPTDNILEKRLFRYDQGNTYNGPRPPTEAELNAYLTRVLNSNDGGDTYFGAVRPLFYGRNANPDERAYSQAELFGNNPFQIGTNNLMGCTVVLLVSQRAVWMAHFWEAYSQGGADSPDEPAFNDRVVRYMRGERGIGHPSPLLRNEPWRDRNDPRNQKNYIAPADPPGQWAINPDNFNGADDKTLLFIMTPVQHGADAGGPLRYAQRIATIRTAIGNIVGRRKPGYAEIPYVTLDPDNVAGDEWLMENTYRGTSLFQYDPNSDGTGIGNRRAWRVFLEGKWFEVVL